MKNFNHVLLFSYVNSKTTPNRISGYCKFPVFLPLFGHLVGFGAPKSTSCLQFFWTMIYLHTCGDIAKTLISRKTPFLTLGLTLFLTLGVNPIPDPNIGDSPITGPNPNPNP